MSIAGVSGIASPSSKVQSISGNISVPAASNENVGSPSIPAEPTQVSAMPLPPMQYVKQYSDDYIKRGLAPPPPPPLQANDSYSMFGNQFTAEDSIIASLESQGIRRLYSAKDVDRKKELRKLNQSILVNFLDLLDILIRAPESPKREEKIDDLNLLFIHMHHLTNEFRPHQARETLRVMLYVQKRKRLQVAEKFREHLDKVQETIQEALDALPDLSNLDDTPDNKLLIPMLINHGNSNASAQVQMTLTSGQSSSNHNRNNINVPGALSEDERTVAINNLDSLVCKMVDDSFTQIEDNQEIEDCKIPMNTS